MAYFYPEIEKQRLEQQIRELERTRNKEMADKLNLKINSAKEASIITDTEAKNYRREIEKAMGYDKHMKNVQVRVDGYENPLEHSMEYAKKESSIKKEQDIHIMER